MTYEPTFNLTKPEGVMDDVKVGAHAFPSHKKYTKKERSDRRNLAEIIIRKGLNSEKRATTYPITILFSIQKSLKIEIRSWCRSFGAV